MNAYQSLTLQKGIETEDLDLLGINDFLAKKLLTLAVRQLQNTR